MGFFSGFIGGFTLTTSILYLTLTIHTSNRFHQHLLIRQQIAILDSITAPFDPDALSERQIQRQEVRRPSLSESLKDRWNGEVEKAAVELNRLEWAGVWERVNAGVRKSTEKVRAVLEK